MEVSYIYIWVMIKHFKAWVLQVNSFNDINFKLAVASTYLRNEEPMEEWTYLCPT